MKVLLLSPYANSLVSTIKHMGDQVIQFREPVETLPEADFVVMFGWRRIIKPPMLTQYKDRIINIHGSYLPWNRGAYPNLFSWVENTPKGVSIHHVDKGIDTGRVIVRAKTEFKSQHTTLKSSYDALQLLAEGLFASHWEQIRLGIPGMEQQPNLGSYHTKQDAEPIIANLPNGWDTKVNEIRPL